MCLGARKLLEILQKVTNLCTYQATNSRENNYKLSINTKFHKTFFELFATEFPKHKFGKQVTRNTRAIINVIVTKYVAKTR